MRKGSNNCKLDDKVNVIMWEYATEVLWSHASCIHTRGFSLVIIFLSSRSRLSLTFPGFSSLGKFFLKFSALYLIYHQNFPADKEGRLNSQHLVWLCRNCALIFSLLSAATFRPVRRLLTWAPDLAMMMQKVDKPLHTSHFPLFSVRTARAEEWRAPLIKFMVIMVSLSCSSFIQIFSDTLKLNGCR
jgi:hypothetical protein